MKILLVFGLTLLVVGYSGLMAGFLVFKWWSWRWEDRSGNTAITGLALIALAGLWAGWKWALS